MKNRLPYIDLLRILATFLVIFNHTETMGFQRYTVAESVIEIVISLILSAYCKIAVPLFLMISGAMLLRKNESLHKLYFSRVWRILLVLFCISAGYYVLLAIQNGEKMNFAVFLHTFYSDHVIVPLWYLYLYLGFLVITPFLRKIAGSMSRNDFIYMTALYAAVRVLNGAGFFSGWNISGIFTSALFPTIDVVYFPLAGYWLEHMLDKSAFVPRMAVFSVCACMSGMLLGAGIIYAAILYTGELLIETLHMSLTFAIAVPTFLLMKYYVGRIVISEKTKHIIAEIGSCVFGVYLIAPGIQSLTKGLYTYLAVSIPDLLACLIWVLIIFVISTALIWSMKKIPFIRNYL